MLQQVDRGVVRSRVGPISIAATGSPASIAAWNAFPSSHGRLSRQRRSCTGSADGPERRARQLARPAGIEDALDEPVPDRTGTRAGTRRTAIAPPPRIPSATAATLPAGKTVSAAATRYGGSAPARRTASAEPSGCGWVT